MMLEGPLVAPGPRPGNRKSLYFMLYGLLLTLNALVCAALVFVVLMQRSEGGALGSGGGPTGLITTRGAGDLLTRTTWILFAIFLTLSMALTLIGARERSSQAILNRLKLQTVNPDALALPGAKPAAATPAAPVAPIAPVGSMNPPMLTAPAAPPAAAPVSSVPLAPTTARPATPATTPAKRVARSSHSTASAPAAPLVTAPLPASPAPVEITPPPEPAPKPQAAAKPAPKADPDAPVKTTTP